MQAYEEGKKIACSNINKEIICTYMKPKEPSWDWMAFDYQVKEEPPKQRMTNRQFVEWCSKGNGQWKWRDISQCHTDYSYSETADNEEVNEDIHIRLWDSDIWIEPTIDIYERDCKGGKE